jgi:hypothetical protein
VRRDVSLRHDGPEDSTQLGSSASDGCS